MGGCISLYCTDKNFIKITGKRLILQLWLPGLVDKGHINPPKTPR